MEIMPTLGERKAHISQRQRKPAATMDRRRTVASESIAATVAEETAYALFRMQVRPCQPAHCAQVPGPRAHLGAASAIRSEFLEAVVNPGHAMIHRRLFRSPGMPPVLHAQEP